MINVDIFPDEVIGEINPVIYGQMIEHAYWSVHMGLWAQMLDNGGFELDKDEKYRTVAQGWNMTSTSPANKVQGSVDGEIPYKENCCEITDSKLLLSFAPASVTILDLMNKSIVYKS